MPFSIRPVLKVYSPPFFTKRLGSGASGTVFRSADGRHVVKVFKDMQTAHHEATLLKLCLSDPHLRTPRFRGLYSNARAFAVVTSYAGTPLPDIFSAADDQKWEIVNILQLLHRNGIHHHDVRAENLMVNSAGVITLVDFDRAVKVDGDCRHCPDAEIMEALQECMRAPEYMDGYDASAYM
ncbi:kinase-like domain-containing protein [Mycena olivaceomarginata]|nr:kinase-like domain-containing protein [Mycena olivaceomarginata]